MKNKHLGLLGMKAKDTVTGFNGVITSVSFDLYGCIQAVISPSKCDKDGKVQGGHWFDIRRLKITSKTPVMEQPDFDKGYIAEGKKGAAIKPLP